VNCFKDSQREEGELIMKNLTLVFLPIAVIVALMLGACAPGRTVRTAAVSSSDIRGTYTLILYGANYGDDLETAAFLDKEGDGYDFEPFAPDFVFRTKKGLTAESALKEAGKFLHFHPDVHGQRLQSIADDKGEIIGYELRPLYLPISLGTDDAIDINYQLKEKRVLIYIKLKPALERRRTFYDDGR
jgi:hypothetical protein